MTMEIVGKGVGTRDIAGVQMAWVGLRVQGVLVLVGVMEVVKEGVLTARTGVRRVPRVK